MRGIGQYFLSGALFICWSILLATWYIVPAVMMAGRNYSNPDQMLEKYRYDFFLLAFLAWLSFTAAIVVLIPASPLRRIFLRLKDEIESERQ